MVFDLCDDISECLGRLQLGALVGHLLGPGRGCLGHVFFGGTTHGGLGTRAQGSGSQNVN